METILRRRNLLLLVCCLFIILLAVPASASALFSNAGSRTGAGFATHGYYFEYAVGFTVPAGPNVVMNSVTLSLARMDSGPSFYADAVLYSDNGGKPGNYSATIGSADPTTTTFADYQMTGPWTLMANTTYWIGVRGNWVYIEGANNAPSGQFTYVGTRSSANSGAWNNASGPFVITLADATAATATVSSITRASSTPANGASASWNVQFSDAVTGLTAANFDLAALGVSGAVISDVSGSGTSWTVTASTGTGDGTLGLNMISGGPENLPFTGEVYEIDKTPPTVVMSSSAVNPTNTSPIPITVTFSEPVTGLTLAGVTVNNGAISDFAGGGAVYTFDVTPAAQGLVTVDVAAGVAQDGAGNGNTAAAQFRISYDSGAPSVNISSAAANPTNASPIPITVTFSESVTDFDALDVVVTNGSVNNFAGSGAVYAFDVTPAAQGLVTVDIGAGVAVDGVGNGNTAAAQFSIGYDSGAPSVVISSAASDPTNASPIPVTVTFSESVTGFDAGGVTVSNGSVDNFAGGGASYTFDVTPAAQGLVTVDIAANAAQDSAGNGNTAAAQFSIGYDNGAPTVVISSAASSPTNSSPIPITVTFSESVTDFDALDVVVTNGLVNNFAGSGAAYTFDVTPAAQGLVMVDIAVGVAVDSAGNGNTAAAQFSIGYDSGAPSVVISSSASNPTNASPIPVTVTFSESVTGFDAGDMAVSNGALSNFAGSGVLYSFDLIPAGAGLVTVDIGADAAVDSANNGNTAAAQFSIGYDSGAPTVVISSAAANPTNASPIPITVTFSEPVTGLTLAGVTVNNGAVDNFAGSGASYTFDVTPAAQGLVTVDIGAGVAQDSAGNGNTAAAQFSIGYDSGAPTVGISSAASNPTNASPIPVTVTFSEPVTGFDAGDVSVGNGAVDNFAGSGVLYSFDLIPAGAGLVTVDIAANVAQDSAGNGNTAAAQFSIGYDSGAPTVVISSAASDPTNASPIPITVTFSESVTGFDALDVVVSNGAISDFAGSGVLYSFDVTPATQGLVTVDIAANVAQDGAGNGNTAAAQFSIDYDSDAPTVVISSAASDPTNASPIPITVTFSESVTGFDALDVVVTNGAVGNFAGSGAVYTFNLTPAAQGLVTVDIGAGVATDSANNGNTAAAQFSISYDSDAPTVVISSSAVNPTNVSPIPITVTFSEAVAGFDALDVVTNGAVDNFAGSGAVYTFDVTPAAQGLVTVDIGAGVATDSANNGNTAAAQFSIGYDSDAPTVVISSAASDPTNSSPIPITVTFSEPVTGFTLAGVTVNNGAVDNFAGGGTVYTFDLTPAAQGLVTVDIGAGVAVDGAGNGNVAAAQFSIGYDSGAPTVSISSAASNPTNASPIPVAVTFSESVTGFDALDVVTNGSVDNFAGGGASYTFDLTPAAQGLVTVDIAAGVAVDGAGNGNTAAAQFGIGYGSAGLPVIELTVLNDGTDAQATIPNPVLAATPSFVITAGGNPDVSVNPASGEFVYAFAPGAPPGVREVTLGISSGGQVFEQIVRVIVLDAVQIAPTATPSPATPDTPPPPPVPLCEDHNFDEGGVVRFGALTDGVAAALNCRVLYQNGAPTTWLGADLYGAGNLGIPGLLDLGVQQAVDVFSPGGLTYFDGGAVFCLRGSGTLIWLAASGIPRHPEIAGSYSVPEFAGFTCVTLFEPGTIILVSDNPVNQE